MLGLRLGAALLPENAQRNCCGHGNADGGKQGVGPTACGQIRGVGLGLHERFLGDKAKGAGQARHRQTAEQCGGGGKRHGLAQERQRADIARAGAVIDIARHEEQGGLVHGVRQQQGRNGKRCLVAGHANDEDQGAQSRHGRPGQNPLQIKFAQRQQHAPRRRDGAGDLQAALPPGPGIHACIQPRQQVHAQLDHGGRVQISRCGRGSRHGIRQPEMEGKLRAFGKSACHDEAHGPVKARAGRHMGQLRHDAADAPAARHLPQQNEAAQ